MASDEAKLSVALEARTRNFERELQKARQTMATETAAMEKRLSETVARIEGTRPQFRWSDSLRAEGDKVSRTMSRISADTTAGFEVGINRAARLSTQQFAILKAAATDAFGSIAAGQSPLTVLTQQAGQVASAIGEDGVMGLLGGVGNGLRGLVTPATAAMAAIVAVGAAGAYSLSRYTEEQLKIELALTGIGRLSGATVDDIRAVGDEAARTGKQSAAAAREVATALAATGKIQGADIAGVTALAPGFAKLFGVDAAKAGAQLAAIFTDPAKGAEQLDGRIGMLDDRTRQYIRTLVEQGNRQDAIKTLIAAVTPALQEAAEKTTIWAKAWNTVASAVDGTANAIGRAMAAPTPQERLSDLMARREAGRSSSEPELVAALRRSGLSEHQIAAQVPTFTPDRAAIDDEIAYVQESIRRLSQLRKAREDAAAANDASKTAGDLVRLFNDEAETVEQLTNRYAALGKALANPAVAERLDGGAEKARTTYEELGRRIEAVTADYRAGGTAAAAALRQADFNKQTAGLDSYRKGLADINRTYDEQIRLARMSGDAATAAARVATLEQARGADVAAYQRNNVERARASVGLPAGFAASVIGAESSGDDLARNARSSAAGAGQFISSTWLELFKRVFSEMAATLSDDAILALRKNRAYTERLIEEYARENALKLQEAGFEGSSRNLQLAHFLGSQGAISMLRADPGANAASILPDAARSNPEVFRRGAASVQDILDYAERRAQRGGASGQAQNNAITALRAEADQYSRTAVEVEKLRSIQEQLDADRERGGELAQRFKTAQDLIKASSAELTPELRAQREEILRLADARAKAAATGLNERFGRDMQNARDALGRTAGEQADFDRVRGYGVDPSSAEGQRMQDELQLMRAMTEARSTASGALSGFASDLMRGTTAAKALENQLLRIADRLIAMAAEKLIAGALGGLLGLGGGNPFSAIASMIGGGGGGADLNGATDLTFWHHAGGPAVKGVGGRRMPSSLFASAPRFHSGSLRPDEYAAVLQEGEEVLTRNQRRGILGTMKSLAEMRGGGTGGVLVNVHPPHGHNAEVSTRQSASGTTVDAIVKRVLAQDFSARGEIAQGLESLYGLNRMAGNRK